MNNCKANKEINKEHFTTYCTVIYSDGFIVNNACIYMTYKEPEGKKKKKLEPNFVCRNPMILCELGAGFGNNLID